MPSDHTSILLEALRDCAGHDTVLDATQLAQRPRSFWDSRPLEALGLVRPRDTATLSAIMRLCAERAQPVVVHGGLTGCVDGAAVQPAELIVSLERMQDIEEIDPIGRTMTVQAGATLQRVQEAAIEQGLSFPLDLGARGSCTIGGNVATNAGGINVIRHGMMRELVLGLEVVLADGTVLSSMNRMLKNNAGYDLKQLFIGSEGTLGIVTRTVLRLKAPSPAQSTALVALKNFAAVTTLLQRASQRSAGLLQAFELMWGNYFAAVTEPGWHRAPMARTHAFYVLLEIGDVAPDSDVLMTLLEESLGDGTVEDAIIPKSEAERRALWAIREDFEAITRRSPCFLYDVSLPIRDMAAYVDTVRTALQARWPQGDSFVLGHIGDGNLHLFVTPGADAVDLHHAVDAVIYAPLPAIGGSVSAEHGIGLEKKAWLAHSRSATEIALMQQLKKLLDPQALLNRGKIFDL